MKRHTEFFRHSQEGLSIVVDGTAVARIDDKDIARAVAALACDYQTALDLIEALRQCRCAPCNDSAAPHLLSAGLL